jgi:hypothetical protein
MFSVIEGKHPSRPTCRSRPASNYRTATETEKATQGGADLLSANVSICPEGWGTDEDS